MQLTVSYSVLALSPKAVVRQLWDDVMWRLPWPDDGSVL